MKKITLIAAPLILVMIIFAASKLPITQEQRLNIQCKDFGNSIVTANEDLFDGSSAISFFYSKRLDTCVKQEVDELGNEYFLCDIKRNYVKQELADTSICGQIFYCDQYGVDNLILEKAEEFGGKLFHLNFSEFLDNGEGGKPRAIETPEEPYSREKCEVLFDKKLDEIK